MSSPLCANCSTILSDLHDNGRVTRDTLPLSSDSCHLCATIRMRCWQCDIDDSCLSSIVYSVGGSPDSGELYIEFGTSDFKTNVVFNMIPSASSGLNITRRCSTDTLSQNAISFLRSKLKECLATHTECNINEPAKEPNYPTRLLSLKGRSRFAITLEDTGEDTRGHYFTLSHCWGGLQPITLTRKSEKSLRAGISLHELPKTFSEAIDVCRQLDIPYLWIDSMCIFQDNLNDWHAEAASMRQIYASALCNIAATGASDASVGLRFERNPLALAPFEVSTHQQFWNECWKKAPIKYLVYNEYSYYWDIFQAPLNQRAWVMQERLLSRRIMHFTASGVYWECLTNMANEVYPQCLPDWIEIASEKLQMKLALVQGDNASHVLPASIDEVYNAWNRFCEDYSMMEMTAEDDKLVAIHGIAQKLSRKTGDRLVCGLWEKCLLPQLLWYPEWLVHLIDPFPLRWRAPSWSWASHNHSCVHAAHLGCSQGQARATVENIAVDAQVSGQLKSASLTLRGKVVNASLSLDTTSPTYHPFETTAHLICGDEVIKVRGPLFDLCSATQTPFHERVLCIGVYEDCCSDNSMTSGPYWAWELGVLILQQCQSDPPRYKRIGIFLFDKEDAEFYTAQETPDEHSITII